MHICISVYFLKKSQPQEETRKSFFGGDRGAPEFGCPLFLSGIYFFATGREKGQVSFPLAQPYPFITRGNKFDVF
jgi:hypothetical protein